MTSYAGVPHTLRNGDIIDAEQLNENFSYNELNITKLSNTVLGLRNGMLDMTSDTFVSTYDASGDLIGMLLINNSNVSLLFNSDFEQVSLYNDGRIVVDGSTNRNTGRFWYLEPGCNGDRYVAILNVSNTHFIFSLPKGRIYHMDGELFYYGPNPSLKKEMTFLSEKNDDHQCIEHPNANPTPSTIIFTKVFPNDSIVTGIKQYPFPTPITFDGINEVELTIQD
jgi:hypothetical protein